jgi:hypothetical protein
MNERRAREGREKGGVSFTSNKPIACETRRWLGPIGMRSKSDRNAIPTLASARTTCEVADSGPEHVCAKLFWDILDKRKQPKNSPVGGIVGIYDSLQEWKTVIRRSAGPPRGGPAAVRVVLGMRTNHQTKRDPPSRDQRRPGTNGCVKGGAIRR